MLTGPKTKRELSILKVPAEIARTYQDQVKSARFSWFERYRIKSFFKKNPSVLSYKHHIDQLNASISGFLFDDWLESLTKARALLESHHNTAQDGIQSVEEQKVLSRILKSWLLINLTRFQSRLIKIRKACVTRNIEWDILEQNLPVIMRLDDLLKNLKHEINEHTHALQEIICGRLNVDQLDISEFKKESLDDLDDFLDELDKIIHAQAGISDAKSDEKAAQEEKIENKAAPNAPIIPSDPQTLKDDPESALKQKYIFAQTDAPRYHPASFVSDSEPETQLRSKIDTLSKGKEIVQELIAILNPQDDGLFHLVRPNGVLHSPLTEEKDENGCYKYVYEDDLWAPEESLILLRIAAHALETLKVQGSPKEIRIPIGMSDLGQVRAASREEAEKWQDNTQETKETKKTKKLIGKVELERGIYPVYEDLDNPIDKKSSDRYILMPLDVELAYLAPATEDENIDPEEEAEKAFHQKVCSAHLNQMINFIEDLKFRFTKNKTLKDPNSRLFQNIELHSAILRSTDKKGYYEDITKHVAAEEGSVPEENTFHRNNRAVSFLYQRREIREALLFMQRNRAAPGYGRNSNFITFPMRNRDLLNYLYQTFGHETIQINFDLFGKMTFDAFNSLEAEEACLDKKLEEKTSLKTKKPKIGAKLLAWLGNKKSKLKIKHYEIRLKILKTLETIKKERILLKEQCTMTNSELPDSRAFSNFLIEAQSKTQIRNPYNRFARLSSKRLLHLAHRAHEAKLDAEKSRAAILAFRPNWLTRLFRWGKSYSASEQAKALLNTHEACVKEIECYIQAIAQEMFIRINLNLEKGLAHDFFKSPFNEKTKGEKTTFFEEFCGFIETYGDFQTKLKLKVRTNPHINLVKLIARRSTIDASRNEMTFYLNQIISGLRNKPTQSDADIPGKANPTSLAIQSFMILRDILLGHAFNTRTITKSHIAYLEDYFDPERAFKARTKNEQVLVKEHKAARLALKNALEKNGFSTTKFFAFLAKYFISQNLSRIFIRAETAQTLIKTVEERNQIKTYVSLMKTFCSDQLYAESYCEKYLESAIRNNRALVWLLEGYESDDITKASSWTETEVVKLFRPIAVLPTTFTEAGKPEYALLSRLQCAKDKFLGTQIIPLVSRTMDFEEYKSALFDPEGEPSKYQGLEFDLKTVMSVITTEKEKGRYLEMRLFKLFEKSLILPESEITFIERFRSLKAVQTSIDNAIRYHYYQNVWDLDLQNLVDSYGSTELQEEIRLDQLESLLGEESKDPDRILELSNVAVAYITHLNSQNITSHNIAPFNYDRFQSILETYLDNDFAPTAFLEQIIFQYTHLTELKDAYVLKEAKTCIKSAYAQENVLFALTDQDKDYRSDRYTQNFHFKWCDRLAEEKNPFTLNRGELDATTKKNQATILSQSKQDEWDNLILKTIQENPYNHNMWFLAHFASESVFQTLFMKLLCALLMNTRYLYDESDKKIKEDKYSEAQSLRKAFCKQVESQSEFLSFSYKTERENDRGFEKEVVTHQSETTPRLIEHLFCQSIGRDYIDPEGLAKLQAIFGKYLGQTFSNLLSKGGIGNIKQLEKLIGQTNIANLQVITRKILDFVQEEKLPAFQPLLIASFFVTDAFVPDNDKACDSRLELDALLTDLNRLRVRTQAQDKMALYQKIFELCLSAHDFNKCVHEIIMPIINLIEDHILLLDHIEKTQLSIQFLNQVFDRLIKQAALFRKIPEFDEEFKALETALNDPLLVRRLDSRKYAHKTDEKESSIVRTKKALLNISEQFSEMQEQVQLSCDTSHAVNDWLEELNTVLVESDQKREEAAQSDSSNTQNTQMLCEILKLSKLRLIAHLYSEEKARILEWIESYNNAHFKTEGESLFEVFRAEEKARRTTAQCVDQLLGNTRLPEYNAIFALKKLLENPDEAETKAARDRIKHYCLFETIMKKSLTENLNLSLPVLKELDESIYSSQKAYRAHWQAKFKEIIQKIKQEGFSSVHPSHIALINRFADEPNKQYLYVLAKSVFSLNLNNIGNSAFYEKIDVDLIFSFIIPFLSSFSNFMQNKQDFLNQITRLSAQSPYLAAFCKSLESKLNNDAENLEVHQNSILQFKSFVAIARKLAHEEAIDGSTVLTIPKDSGYANELQMRLKQLSKDKVDCPAWYNKVNPLIKHLGTKEDQKTLIRVQERFGTIDINRQSLLDFVKQVYAQYTKVNKNNISCTSSRRIRNSLTLLRNPETTLNESIDSVKALIEPSYGSFTLFKSWTKSFVGCFQNEVKTDKNKDFKKRFFWTPTSERSVCAPENLSAGAFKILCLKQLDIWGGDNSPEDMTQNAFRRASGWGGGAPKCW